MIILQDFFLNNRFFFFDFCFVFVFFLLAAMDHHTGEDLGLKPITAEKAKFEYSPQGKIFNKGLDKNDQKEGLLKNENGKLIKMKSN